MQILAIEMGVRTWRLARVERRAKGPRILDSRSIPLPAPDAVEAAARELSAHRLPIVCIPQGNLRLHIVDLPQVAWRYRAGLVRERLLGDQPEASRKDAVAFRLVPVRGRLQGVAATFPPTLIPEIRASLGSLHSNLRSVIPAPIALSSELLLGGGPHGEEVHDLAVHFDREGLLLVVVQEGRLSLVRHVPWGESAMTESETARSTSRAVAFEEIRRSLVHQDMREDGAISRVLLSGELSPEGEDLERWRERLDRPVVMHGDLHGVAHDGSGQSHIHALCLGAASLAFRGGTLDLLRPVPPLPRSRRVAAAAVFAASLALAVFLHGENRAVDLSCRLLEGELEARRARLQEILDREQAIEEDREELLERRDLEVAVTRFHAGALPLDLWLEELLRRSPARVALTSCEIHRQEEGRFSAALAGSVEGSSSEATEELGHVLDLWRGSPLVRQLHCRLDPGQGAASRGKKSVGERLRFSLLLELE
jgi:hypothetical protein